METNRNNIKSDRMQANCSIPEIRLLGFYQLKELLGLGDDRLQMILRVGEVKPIMFTNPKSGRQDKLYSYFSVKLALEKLQGVDVQIEDERSAQPDVLDLDEVKKKSNNVRLRLLKRKAV